MPPRREELELRRPRRRHRRAAAPRPKAEDEAHNLDGRAASGALGAHARCDGCLPLGHEQRSWRREAERGASPAIGTARRAVPAPSVPPPPANAAATAITVQPVVQSREDGVRHEGTSSVRTGIRTDRFQDSQVSGQSGIRTVRYQDSQDSQVSGQSGQSGIRT